MPKHLKYGDVTYEVCEFLFVVKGLSMEEIAKREKPSYATLNRWREKFSWGEMRTLRMASPREIAMGARRTIQDLYNQARAEDRPVNGAEHNIIFQQFKMIEKLDGDGVFASNALAVLDDFSSWLQARDHNLYRELTPLISDYAHDVVERVSTDKQIRRRV